MWLGKLIFVMMFSEKSIQLLVFYLHDLLLYMKKNASLIFSLADYQDVP